MILLPNKVRRRGGPMETFRKLFASLLVLVYHCFDRVVIQGYLPLLTRPEHIVYFFRDVHGIYPITKQALRQRTQDYQHWVEAFARNHRIPLEWPDPDMRRKASARKTSRGPISWRWSVADALASTSSSKPWNRVPTSAPASLRTLPKILAIASSSGSGRVTPTSTSTFAMRCSVPMILCVGSLPLFHSLLDQWSF